jgi:hypothetical protein
VIGERLVSPSLPLRRRYSCKVGSENTKIDSYLNKEENKGVDNDKLNQRDFKLDELKKEISSDSKRVTELIIISLNKGR